MSVFAYSIDTICNGHRFLIENPSYANENGIRSRNDTDFAFTAKMV